ncbi:unnamed protein product [Notodromas monacha]|uniref:GDP-fucose protein O-fucosyltransferase 1 n=1 Tax=Notodromas monacha TaxID=399045 RepID=A0A7R9BJE2_9CRUS|nr:unnamed protein product [Notodromas monacha]CAG0915483.1 unnamed protein product [Notodromas monacha]
MDTIFKLLSFILVFELVSGDTAELDTNGYVTYCPCMGRFGNQADHFLGSLSFAKALNRTLVLPHWILHRPPRDPGPTSVMIPFDDWFEVEPLKAFHRVVLMKDFIARVSPVVWSPENRTGTSVVVLTMSLRSRDVKVAVPCALFI